MCRATDFRLTSAVVGVVASIVFANPAVAQSTPAAAAPSTTAPSSSDADAIVVTAQHKRENVQTVPISIEALSGQAIENLGVKSTTDLGKVAAAVNIVLPAGQGNQPVITIRGIGINDNNSNNAGSAGVYVDEFYLSAPTSQTLSLFDLDRVEVLKGPQGTLYGRNTSVGAINLVTAKPNDDFGGYLRGTVGNYDSYSIEGAVGGKIAEGVDGRFSFARNYSAGYFTNLTTGNHSNGANDYELRGQILLKPMPDLKILLTTAYARVDRLPDEYLHLGGFQPGTQTTGGAMCAPAVILNQSGGCVDLFGGQNAPGNYTVYGERTQHLQVTDFAQTARVDWTPGTLNFVSLSQYHFNKRFLPEETDADQYRLLEVNYFNKSHEYTQEFRLSQNMPRYNWVAGLYYLHEDLIQSQNLQQLFDFDRFFGAGSGDLANNNNDITQLIPQNYIGNSKQVTDAYAAFGQAEYKVLSKFSVVAGLRYTKEKRSFGINATAQYQVNGIDNFGPPQQVVNTIEHLDNQAVNYRVGLNYNPTGDILIYGSIASGFKSGDFNGGFLSNVPSVAATQTVPVGPERATTYETGLKSQWFDHKLTLNVSLYYNDYRDLQIFAFINENIGGSVQVVNTLTSAQKARSYGADIEIGAKPIRNLSLDAQIGVLNTRLAEYTGAYPELFVGRPLVFAPRFSTFLTADYRVPLNDYVVNLNANAAFKSKQELTSTVDTIDPAFSEQSAYWLIGSRISLSHGNLEVGAYVNNLFDKHYVSTSFDAIEPFGFLELVVGQPRTYGLDVKLKF